jgi:hypothetical protein
VGEDSTVLIQNWAGKGEAGDVFSLFPFLPFLFVQLSLGEAGFLLEPQVLCRVKGSVPCQPGYSLCEKITGLFKSDKLLS